MHIESLERRVLASITLQNFELRCEGRIATNDDFLFANSDDLLIITHRKRFTDQTIESAAFKRSDISVVRVNLGVGDDRVAFFLGNGPITEKFIIDGGAGNDLLSGGELNDTINGGSGDDTIFAGNGADLVRAGIGNDTILGGGGSDALFGDAGNDTLKGEAGNDKLFGNDGNDTFFGGPGADVIDGGAGDDTFVGFDPLDTGSAGTGSSTFIPGLGNDGVIINGGSGPDNIHISRRVTPAGAFLEVNHNGFKWSLLYTGGETVTVLAGRGNDLVTMDPSASTWRAKFFGQGGNDLLVGSSNNDVLDGGEGSNLLVGEGGFDSIVNGVKI